MHCGVQPGCALSNAQERKVPPLSCIRRRRGHDAALMSDVPSVTVSDVCRRFVSIVNGCCRHRAPPASSGIVSCKLHSTIVVRCE
eukprot:3840539-Prymnesium_polylepis.2